MGCVKCKKDGGVGVSQGVGQGWDAYAPYTNALLQSQDFGITDISHTTQSSGLM